MWLVEPLEKRSVYETITWTKEIDGKTYTLKEHIGYRWGSISYTERPNVQEDTHECFNIYDIGDVYSHDFDGETWFHDVSGIEDLPEEEREALEEVYYDFYETEWYDEDVEFSCCGPLKITEE